MPLYRYVRTEAYSTYLECRWNVKIRSKFFSEIPGCSACACREGSCHTFMFLPITRAAAYNHVIKCLFNFGPAQLPGISTCRFCAHSYSEATYMCCCIVCHFTLYDVGWVCTMHITSPRYRADSLVRPAYVPL